jgi:DNA-directed RNA polymerase III subunit RPC8
MVVFRPFVGEVIVGRIFSISKTGIRVTLDFFDDIVLPPHLWQSHSEFNEETGTIVWKYSEETEDDFVMQQGDEVKRVVVRVII